MATDSDGQNPSWFWGDRSWKDVLNTAAAIATVCGGIASIVGVVSYFWTPYGAYVALLGMLPVVMGLVCLGQFTDRWMRDSSPEVKSIATCGIHCLFLIAGIVFAVLVLRLPTVRAQEAAHEKQLSEATSNASSAELPERYVLLKPSVDDPSD